jgi:hypothetical protein
MIAASRPSSKSLTDDLCNQFAPQTGPGRKATILKPMPRAEAFWKSFQTERIHLVATKT